MEFLITAFHARGIRQLKENNPTQEEFEDSNGWVNMGSFVDKCSVSSLLQSDIDHILRIAFNHFNWMTDDRMGQAPDEVNLIARYNNTHSSMSVGDVVRLQYGIYSSDNGIVVVTRYFECLPVGWEEITD